MAAASQPAKGAVLNSWKEIAVYLGRGVRTVQRYERDLGLPVRRPRGRSRSAVLAIPDELDAWVRRAPRNDGSEAPTDGQTVPFGTQKEVILQSALLRERCNQLCLRHTEVLATLIANLQTTMAFVSERKAPRGGRQP